MSVEERLRGLEQYREQMQHAIGVYSNRANFNIPYSGQWIYPNSPYWIGTANAPLTSTAWDGDSFSTTAKTLIDLSTVFGVPAGIKAVLLMVVVRDSASATVDTKLTLSPNNTYGEGMVIPPLVVNDRRNRVNVVVPCDANGDIYYQVDASGSDTFDVTLQVWGYVI